MTLVPSTKLVEASARAETSECAREFSSRARVFVSVGKGKSPLRHRGMPLQTPTRSLVPSAREAGRHRDRYLILTLNGPRLRLDCGGMTSRCRGTPVKLNKRSLARTGQRRKVLFICSQALDLRSSRSRVEDCSLLHGSEAYC